MRSLLMVAASLLILASCKKEENPFDQPAQVSALEKKISDLSIDSANGRYTLFNLETGKVVPNSDSASDNWHIGFLSTTIIVNSGVSGPGNTQGQVITGIYDNYNEATTTGFKADGTGISRAVPTGSGNGWYSYNSDTHVISPTPGRLLLFKTSDNKYCKMEILSYYKGAPAQPTAEMESRTYTFRYVYQGNGTTSFK
ncbi:MAG: HmuY family protein [Bacteroidota bacterium]